MCACIAHLDCCPRQAANTSAEDEIIDKAEYLEMHRRVVLSLQPTVLPHEAIEAAEEDWERDSEGKPGLDRARFYICWFELADLWTDDIDRDEYVDFLEAQRQIITERLPDGRVPITLTLYPQPLRSPSPSPSPLTLTRRDAQRRRGARGSAGPPPPYAPTASAAHTRGHPGAPASRQRRLLVAPLQAQVGVHLGIAGL